MGDGIIQSWEPTRSNCGRLRIAYAALFFFRCRSTCPQCTRKGPMNVSTLQRNRNGHPKEMTFSISRQWRFKRYSNLKLGYLKNSLVKNFLLPIFMANKRHRAKKKSSRVRSVYSNFVRKYGVLNMTKL